MDDLIRKLILLGAPLLPAAAAGCSFTESSCPDEAPKPVSRYEEIAKPAAADAGAGWGETMRGSYERCAESGDCMAACEEHFRGRARVIDCVRVPVVTDASGEVVAVQARLVFICEGRRPEGLPPASARPDGDAFAAWLAEAARLEAASVPAFTRLAIELEAHAAPHGLVARARDAAIEESRHTRLMTALARRHGVQPRAARHRPPMRVRALEAVARENAIEGCVRETLGALLAHRQARVAGDEGLRSAMQEIAADEASHAELAWAIDEWAAARLRPDAARGLRSAKRDAFAALEREVSDVAPGDALVRAAGLPTAAEARAIVAATARALSAA